MKNNILKICLATAIVGNIALGSNYAFAADINTKNSNYEQQIITAENNQLQNGQYTVNIETLKENSDELSMAGQYIDKTANVNVENGTMTLSLRITKINWMKNIEVAVDGSIVNYETVMEGDDGKVATISFPITGQNPNIVFHMNVEPMGNARVCFRVALQGDFNKVGENVTTTASNTENNDSKNNTNGENKELPKTGSMINNKGLIAIGSLAAVSGILLKRRK